MLFLAAYDISSDRRRQRVAKILQRFGNRIQESVFELRLSPEEILELQRLVGAHLATEDCFEIVPVDERLPRHRLR